MALAFGPRVAPHGLRGAEARADGDRSGRRDAARPRRPTENKMGRVVDERKKRAETKNKQTKQESAKWGGGNQGPHSPERRRKNDGEVGEVGSGGHYAA